MKLGTAGWAIPRTVTDRFPTSGTGLERYAAQFNAVEINSTFYRSHRASTYARWAITTPASFRFAVKVPRTITHNARLRDCKALVSAFLVEVRALGEKLGVLLVQLPPSLAFEPELAATFFQAVRELEPELPIACEPRHATWFGPAAHDLFVSQRIARVAADPASAPSAAEPGGWTGFAYHRLHGSPRMYASAYSPEALEALARSLATAAPGSWCIFDNTALGAAAADALELKARLHADLRPNAAVVGRAVE